MMSLAQCQAHKFEPLTKKFNIMADSLKSDSGVDEVSAISNSLSPRNYVLGPSVTALAAWR